MASTIRPAVAEDRAFLAEIMHESTIPVAGRGLFDAALEGTGTDPLAFNEALLTTGSSSWGGIQDFVVLEEDGERAAAAAAYLSSNPDRRPLSAEGFEAVSSALGWSQDAAQAFWRSYVAGFGFFGNAAHLEQPAPYVLEYVAVKPDYKGRRLVNHLLAAHAERARAAGHPVMGVSAMYGNEPAIRAYLRFGFREVARVGPERFGGKFPGMIRYIIDL